MNRTEFNSTPERLLVLGYRWLASRLDLHSGVAGWIYRKAYFLYKNATEGRTMDTIVPLIRRNTMVVDVGANIGSFARMICRRSPATVLAFEPDPDNFRQLQRLVDSRVCRGRINAWAKALSDTTGPAFLYLSDLAPTDHKLVNTRSRKRIEIEATTLDDFLTGHRELAGTPVSLVKIDVQGVELRVLAGMRETLRRNDFPPVLTEFSPSDLEAAGVSIDEFFRAFADLGYAAHRVPEGDARDPGWFARNTGAYRNILMMRAASGNP
jgi:FkbM family methyltransferase